MHVQNITKIYVLPSILISVVCWMCLLSVSINQSEAMITRSHQLMNGIRYEADYEVQVKNGNEKTYIAYIIEQGDLIVKKKCACTSWSNCDMKNAIKLSK